MVPIIPPGVAADAAEQLARQLNRRSVGHVNIHPQSRGLDASDADLDALRRGPGPDDLENEIARRNAAAAANAASHAGATDMLVEGASTLTEIPNKVAMMGVLPLMAGGALVKGIGKLVDGKEAQPGKISRFGYAMTGPVRWLNAPIEDWKVMKPVGWVAGGLTNLAARPIEWITRSTGINGWREGKNVAHANMHFDAVQSAFKNADTVRKLNAVTGVGVQGLHDFDGLLEKIQKAETITELASHATEIEVAKKALYHAHPRHTSEAKALIESAHDALWHHERADHWNKGKPVSNGGKMLGKAKLGMTAWNAGFVGMDSIAMYGTAKTFGENVHSLKQMYADMTGTKVENVSTLKILMGSVPEPVRVARSQLIKHLGVDGVLQTTGLFFSLKQLVGGHFSGKAMGVQMGTAFAGGPLKALIAESAAPIYGALSAAQARGETLPAEVYAEFLTKINTRFNNLGAENKITMAVATKLAQEKTGVGAIMKLQAAHKLEALGNEAAKQMDNAHPHASATHGSASVVPQAQTHVESLNNKGSKQYAEVGPHTRGLNLRQQPLPPLIPGRT